ncbi:DsbA family protein [Nocardioides aequoreus]|uniref:DsbA family protein n=1 Tax=Nocardioides aequoreus TaxID=397278 RepID=UPI0005606C31|nr:thioredoxin domain-containing protein [Nocardioides aequoreus]
MRTQTKLAVALGTAVVLILAVLVVGVLRQSGEGPRAVETGGTADTPLMRADSRILGGAGSSAVTVVEFLDFECEACGAAYPVVEQLRDDYQGKVTFVARYFPLPGHFNSERAAWAVESAARQDRFEEMYQKMFETQAEWGEQRVGKDRLFRGFAEDLGLDMAKFDRDYASDEVRERVQRDVDDGEELGVTGTPTFYIDGEPFQPSSVQDFYDRIDDALSA